MVTLKEQVPKSLRTPVSLLSFVVGGLGAVLAWILVLLGLSLYFNLYNLEDAISSGEALTVLAVGLVAGVVGYAGLKGFMYFSY